MATYHICDLCGKDLEYDGIYYIQIGPKYSIKDLDKISERSLKPTANKEVCRGCAAAYAGSLDEAEKRREDQEKRLFVGERLSNGLVDDGVWFNLGFKED